MAIVIFLTLYIVAIFVSLWLPANNDFETSQNRNIEIFVESNGVHTDVLLPTDTSRSIDRWLVKQSSKNGRIPNYIAYGWGDKGFYLDTPTWADLKFSTAFKAVTGLSSAAMHITLFPNQPKVDGHHTFKILVNGQQLEKLREYVHKDFVLKGDTPQYIDCCWYYSDKRDAFYDANGSYSLFKTCNVWTNGALKHAGIKTALWAPFSDCVTYHLKE